MTSSQASDIISIICFCFKKTVCLSVYKTGF